VSVIGPRWLALRDETTGIRLIDPRPRRVRRELAMASKRVFKSYPCCEDTPGGCQACPRRPETAGERSGPLPCCRASGISQPGSVRTWPPERPGVDLNTNARPVAGANGHTSTPVRPLERNAFFEVVERP